nr:hypothetical protein [Tanacetum cinerariifolium]
MVNKALSIQKWNHVLILMDLYVIGHVVVCEDLDNYDKNRKSVKKKVLTFVDDEEEFQVVKEYSLRLFAREDVDNFENTALRISTTSKNSTKESFVTKFPPRNIVELLDVAHEFLLHVNNTPITSGLHYTINITIIRASIKSCRPCRKKVMRLQDNIDLEAEPKKVLLVKMIGGAPSAMSFQDKTGTMSLTLWNGEVQDVVDMSAYQLCDKYGKGEQNDQFPTEITALIGKKYAFKVSIDEYNVKKLFLVFTVLRLSDDQILDLSVFLLHQTSEATSSALPSITLLDLESQTNENTTPVNTKKNNDMDDVDKEESSDGKNKCPDENDISNESSNGKK